jgi:hypothetical protein
MEQGHFCMESVEMSGIPPEVIEHTINIKPDSEPVKQGMRCFNQEKR